MKTKTVIYASSVHEHNAFAKDDITLALLKIFKAFLPIPTANVFAHPCWQSSVFSGIGQGDATLIEANDLFKRKWQSKSAATYLEWLAEAAIPSDFIFRSDVECLKYLKKWLRFQFGAQWSNVVKCIFS